MAGITTAASQQHISHAGLQGIAVSDLQIQVIQLLQKAVFLVIPQLRQVVRHVVLHGIFRRREQSQCQRFLFGQFSEAVFQCFDDLRLIRRLHGPDGNPPCKAAGVGIGNVKVVFQPGASVVFAIKNSDTGCAPVDPTPKTLIPAIRPVNRQDSGRVRTLGK